MDTYDDDMMKNIFNNGMKIFNDDMMEIFLMDVMKNIFNGCDEIFNDGMMEIFLMMI